MNLRTIITRRGFSLIEFMFVVVALAVLVALLVPGYAKRHSRSSRIGCVNNLKQAGLAFRQWALDNGDKNPMQVSLTAGGTMEQVASGNVYVHFQVMSNELNTPKVLICPRESDPKRQAATTFAASLAPGASNSIPFTNDYNVSYFIGVDAANTSPQMFLAGDDNWAIRGVKVKRGILSLWTNTPVSWTKERHVNQGNVALADGSVQGFSTAKLRAALCGTGDLTNRLAFP